MKKGMRVGGRHTWNYKTKSNKQTKKGKNITFKTYQTKKRAGKQYKKGYPIGGKLHWKINGIEIVKKLPNGTYQKKIMGRKLQSRIALDKYGKLR